MVLAKLGSSQSKPKLTNRGQGLVGRGTDTEMRGKRCLSVLPVCMLVHHLCACCLWSPEGLVGSLGPGATEKKAASCIVDAGDQSQVLCKSREHF